MADSWRATGSRSVGISRSCRSLTKQAIRCLQRRRILNRRRVQMSNPFDFDKEYKKGNLWGSEPSRLLEIALEYVSSGTVLDIGAGQGRSTLPLARKGFDVTCIDTAQTGIEQILSVARAEGLSINAVTGDIRKFPMQ